MGRPTRHGSDLEDVALEEDGKTRSSTRSRGWESPEPPGGSMSRTDQPGQPYACNVTGSKENAIITAGCRVTQKSSKVLSPLTYCKDNPKADAVEARLQAVAGADPDQAT
ncbi:Hypp7525 [Branchiostoma lanceolatum]|uniref:Hypp7525 protein n=1 Tax=Branchiostoma lanceolatum TaxID=7740 RepID=A0A8J9Z1Y4_BRALA|nr:Hypp7525 [Branchiostoma lanceolatum]